jgi:tetratricopeptide (TPR) repeat protein
MPQAPGSLSAALLLVIFLLLPAPVSSAPELSGAVELYRARNYEEATKALEQLRVAEPENPEIIYYLGLTARRQKRFDEAVRLLEDCVKRVPSNPDYHVALGDAYGALASKNRSFTQASRARSSFETAVALAPRSEKARAALIDYCREAPSIAGGGMGKAYAHAKEFQALEPAAGTRLLVILYVSEKRYADAIAACRDFLRSSPEDYTINYQLGRVAAISGSSPDEGIAALEKCLTLAVPEDFPGHAHVHTRLGQLYTRKGNAANARKHFEAALALDPNLAEAKEGLGESTTNPPPM